MRVLWVNPSFLDYRVATYKALDLLIGGNLWLVYSKERTPIRVVRKAEAALGPRAVGLVGERHLPLGEIHADVANRGLLIPFQPGLVRTIFGIAADVVIGEGFFQWTPGAILKKLAHHIALTISYERTAHTERNCPAWRVGYRKCVVRLADSVLCNGLLSSQYVRSLGMPASRVVTGGMAADSKWLRIASAKLSRSAREQSRRSLGLQSPVFLYVGQMEPRKGVRELLFGWRTYVSRGGNGTLLLAGDGPELPDLRAMARHSGLDSVHFLGYVAYERLPQTYALADVFVIATLEDNWTLVVPEAMACGLPIACSERNGCWPELVREGENGFVFDPTRPEKIAGCLQRFSDSPGSWVLMGERSRGIESRYGPDHAASAALRACELALAHHGRHTSSCASA